MCPLSTSHSMAVWTGLHQARKIWQRSLIAPRKPGSPSGHAPPAAAPPSQTTPPQGPANAAYVRKPQADVTPEDYIQLWKAIKDGDIAYVQGVFEQWERPPESLLECYLLIGALGGNACLIPSFKLMLAVRQVPYLLRQVPAYEWLDLQSAEQVLAGTGLGQRLPRLEQAAKVCEVVAYMVRYYLVCEPTFRLDITDAKTGATLLMAAIESRFLPVVAALLEPIMTHEWSTAASRHQVLQINWRAHGSQERSGYTAMHHWAQACKRVLLVCAASRGRRGAIAGRETMQQMFHMLIAAGASCLAPAYDQTLPHDLISGEMLQHLHDPRLQQLLDPEEQLIAACSAIEAVSPADINDALRGCLESSFTDPRGAAEAAPLSAPSAQRLAGGGRAMCQGGHAKAVLDPEPLWLAFLELLHRAASHAPQADASLKMLQALWAAYGRWDKFGSKQVEAALRQLLTSTAASGTAELRKKWLRARPDPDAALLAGVLTVMSAQVQAPSADSAAPAGGPNKLLAALLDFGFQPSGSALVAAAGMPGLEGVVIGRLLATLSMGSVQDSRRAVEGALKEAAAHGGIRIFGALLEANALLLLPPQDQLPIIVACCISAAAHSQALALGAAALSAEVVQVVASQVMALQPPHAPTAGSFSQYHADALRAAAQAAGPHAVHAVVRGSAPAQQALDVLYMISPSGALLAAACLGETLFSQYAAGLRSSTTAAEQQRLPQLWDLPLVLVAAMAERLLAYFAGPPGEELAQAVNTPTPDGLPALAHCPVASQRVTVPIALLLDSGADLLAPIDIQGSPRAVMALSIRQSCSRSCCALSHAISPQLYSSPP
ncbi:hypothetical protein WJX72_003115 [[Myrmecia] bisecta]|uniref:Uncharacterized protein n=1 Tax=[Myrmecia] bisecta TaxID=41462 RepID=A0AAW1QQG1_9CHLO